MPTDQQNKKPGGIEFYGSYQVYSDTGIDLTLLRRNLELSFEERIENNSRALEFATALQQSEESGFEADLAVSFHPPGFYPMAILQQLADRKVEYLLFGGLVLAAYGCECSTQELGICYSRTVGNVARLALALAPLHPRLRGDPHLRPLDWSLETLQTGVNFALTTDCGEIDLLGELVGLGSYEQAVIRGRKRTILGLGISVLSPEALIASKRVAGTMKDHFQVRELEALKSM